jgi:hypothetical protein
MFRGMKVLGGVLVLRGIATPDVAAFKTQAQMDPRVTHLEALFATFRVRLGMLGLLQVNASGTHFS